MGSTGEVTMGIRMTAYRLPLALSFLVAVAGSLPDDRSRRNPRGRGIDARSRVGCDQCGEGRRRRPASRGDGGVEARMELRPLGEDESDHDPGRRNR